MTAFFSYSAIGLGLLMIILALLTCIISSHRLSLFWITVQLLINIFAVGWILIEILLFLWVIIKSPI
jgi:hypothetical protein